MSCSGYEPDGVLPLSGHRGRGSGTYLASADVKEPPYTPVPLSERSKVYCVDKCHYVDPHDPSWRPCEVLCQVLRIDLLRDK